MAPSVKLERIASSHLAADSVFQSRFWAEVKRDNWDSLALGYEIGEKRGTVLILIRRLFLSFSIAYSPFGLFSDLTAEEFTAFAHAVRRELPRSVFFLRFDFPWGSHPLSASRIHLCKESVQPEGTVRIALPSEFHLKERAKRNLRKEEGVSVRLWDGSEEEFSAWFTTYKVTGLRDNFETREEGYIRHILDIEDGQVKPLLYIAHYQEEVIGGILNLRSQKEEVYLFGSSVKTTGSTSCGYSLQNHAINEAAKAGVEVYDLFGIPSKGGGSHLEKLEVFKTAFGGAKVYRSPSTDYSYNNLIYFCYRFAENIRYALCRDRI